MQEHDRFADPAATANSNFSNKQANAWVTVHKEVLALNFDLRVRYRDTAQENYWQEKVTNHVLDHNCKWPRDSPHAYEKHAYIPFCELDNQRRISGTVIKSPVERGNPHRWVPLKALMG